MFSIILKHVIGEVAINTFFDKLTENFHKPLLVKALRDAAIIYQPYIKQMRIIQDDIGYFERRRYDANARVEGSGDRYTDIANRLKEAESSFYQHITFSELAEENIQKNTSRTIPTCFL